MTHEAERRVIVALVQRLSRRFPAVDRAVISEEVRRIYQRFDQHPRCDFVPILVEDAATDLLRAQTSDRKLPLQRRSAAPPRHPVRTPRVAPG
jgi:hypothetical protein